MPHQKATKPALQPPPFTLSDLYKQRQKGCGRRVLRSRSPHLRRDFLIWRPQGFVDRIQGGYEHAWEKRPILIFTIFWLKYSISFHYGCRQQTTGVWATNVTLSPAETIDVSTLYTVVADTSICHLYASPRTNHC